MSEVKNIYQRINEVMQKVRYLKKDSNVNNRYKAVSHDNVIGFIREHLVKAGIVVYTNLKSDSQDKVDYGKSGGYYYTGHYEVIYVNIDNPEDKLIVNVTGHSIDTDGKQTGKALSYATKYAHLKTFSIETGEDEEARTELIEGFDSNRRDEIMEELTEAAQKGKLNEAWKAADKKDLELISRSKKSELKTIAKNAKVVENGTA